MNTLSRWEPFRTLAGLQDEMDRLFDPSVVRNRTAPSTQSAWAPAVDILETKHELVLKADLPEMDEKEIDIRVEENALTLSGERKFEKVVKEDNFLRVERSFGTFSRSFSLPTTVNTEAIKAEYKDGVLTVHLPKREESKPIQIKVGVNGSK